MSACACSDALKLQNSLTVRDTDREAAIIEEQRFLNFAGTFAGTSAFPYMASSRKSQALHAGQL